MLSVSVLKVTNGNLSHFGKVARGKKWKITNYFQLLSCNSLFACSTGTSVQCKSTITLISS